jgi:hypothetical protein
MVVTAALVVGTWNDTEAATNVVAMRVFLIGWALAAVVIVAESPLATSKSHDGQGRRRGEFFPTAQHVAMGLVLGLAIGTTDWTSLRLIGWWQLWWTVPLLLAYIGFIGTLWRSSRASS